MNRPNEVAGGEGGQGERPGAMSPQRLKIATISQKPANLKDNWLIIIYLVSLMSGSKKSGKFRLELSAFLLQSIQILDHAVVEVTEEEYFAIGAET